MDKAPLVTIIVPCYNGAGFLRKRMTACCQKRSSPGFRATECGISIPRQGQDGAGRRLDMRRNRQAGGALVKARLDFDSKGGGAG
jgi:hypothetical protein